MCLRNVILAALVSVTAASAQYSPFMVRYAANLGLPDSDSSISINGAPMLRRGLGVSVGKSVKPAFEAALCTCFAAC